jgi:hypothetical protein
MLKPLSGEIYSTKLSIMVPCYAMDCTEDYYFVTVLSELTDEILMKYMPDYSLVELRHLKTDHVLCLGKDNRVIVVKETWLKKINE